MVERSSGRSTLEVESGERSEPDGAGRALATVDPEVAEKAERWMLIEREQGSIPTVFLVVLVFWLVVLFFSFGLFAPRNPTVMWVCSSAHCRCPARSS